MYVHLYAPREREPIGALRVSFRWSDGRGPLVRACFLVCSPSQRGAIQLVARANRHVRATALYGDGFITGLRFDSFAFVRAGAMDAGRARR